jgi:hypothetical protein
MTLQLGAALHGLADRVRASPASPTSSVPVNEPAR